MNPLEWIGQRPPESVPPPPIPDTCPACGASRVIGVFTQSLSESDPLGAWECEACGMSERRFALTHPRAMP